MPIINDMPKCVQCQKTDSFLWRLEGEGQICQECFEEKENAKTQENVAATTTKVIEEKSVNSKEGSAKELRGRKAKDENAKRVRKSTRATRFKARGASSQAATISNGGNSNAGGGKSQLKGRNRRNLFKRAPQKTPIVQATTHSTERLFYKGSYIQVGDIVSVIDSDDNVYYAQIRGLLVDIYSEKSAYLTWLVPTKASPNPKDGFDPATYLIGTDEELSRKLSCMEFVMHAPSNYYKDRNTPFPLPDYMSNNIEKSAGFIWTSLPGHKRNQEKTKEQQK